MPYRPLALLAATALAASLAVGIAAPVSADPLPTPALGFTGVPTPSDPTDGRTPADTPVDLTIVLRPTDQAALRALPTTTAEAGVAERGDAVDAVAPAAQRGAAVRTALVAAGFAVTDLDTWELEATGTAARAEALFGVQLLGTGDGMHPVSDAVLPASFGDAVTTVLGLDTRPAAAHSALPGGYAPADLARAYGSSSAATAGAGTTVATVQFSGWDRNDLVAYAAAVGRAVPAVDQIAIDGADVHRFDGAGGETEVALDQQALLATAPAARQRVYVAPNSFQGIYDSYSRIADDVQRAGITAVSVSWGSCESLTSAGARAAIDDALDRIVAAGATVFAASGDDGADCPTGPSSAVRSVTYPASSPAVVAVGGTSLTTTASSTTESAWGNDLGASGGGTSAAYARPAWQTGVGVSGRQRLVPDIASTADPAKGPGIYLGSAHGFVYGGGTSLAAPVVAGQLAAALGAQGCTAGVGDLHQTIYANPGAFRDVTTGTSGLYRAARGHDRATGLGTPRWSVLGALLPASACASGTPAGSAAAAGATATGITGSAAAAPSGTSIRSPHGLYWLDVQADGRLVEWGGSGVLWSTPTRSPGATLAVGTDGTLALRATSGATLWSAGSPSAGDAPTLQVSDLGVVQLVRGSTVLWQQVPATRDRLVAGGSLLAGQEIRDTTGVRRLLVRVDGQLRIIIGTRTVFTVAGGPGAALRMQADGNVVLYDAVGRARWSTRTGRFGGSGMELRMRTDGDLVLTQGATRRWHSGTKG
ncbi:hypothetical protein ASG04_05295 [Curtobacterium sp. Leaf183]|uniref:S8 family serine peptidase n=1 Tax=Curtobacterium sp. Leaf183 TaxID=1736291 RepID=UPI0006F6ADC6|nr:S8 family serine peptidase [Curtobacterium sp. Leaf183]KQS10001.1 hypothetical protein ASG04_05295 [Curtobacterium sp. Leaf183]